MDINWLDQAMHEEQRKDMLRAAARRSLAAQALEAARRPPFYAGALVRLGQWLEQRGRRIQLRYGILTDTTPHSAVVFNAKTQRAQRR